MALIRYPGSKEKLRRDIIEYFPDQMRHALWSCARPWQYREPFFGAGAIGFRTIPHLSDRVKVWLNDKDAGMVALWRSVRDDPAGLIELVHDFTPAADLFRLFKTEDGRTGLPPTVAGFRKLALHMMSYSGLGFMAGGPLGGRDQDSAEYPVGCRWRPGRIKVEIMRLHKELRRFPDFRLSGQDFAPLIEGAPEECFIYADPPYYEKGPGLYKHSMSPGDHERLATLLRACPASWVLSYDDHPTIRSLYSWARIDSVNITYTTATRKGGRRPKNREVVITPPRTA